MKIKSNSDCTLLRVAIPQLEGLFSEGEVDKIDVELTHNCCKTFDFTVGEEESECVWTAYGDYLASPVDLYPVDETTICSIRMDREVDGDQEIAFPVGPVSEEGCEGCIDISTPNGRNDLTVAVNNWLTSVAGGGTFEIIVSDGVPNTPYEESIGSASVFTMTFTDVAGGWRPIRYQIGTACGNSAGGFYSLADSFFTCGGISTEDYVYNAGELLIRPSIMGESEFPDGVYGISITAFAEDGSKVVVNECYLMDCELKCKVLDSDNKEAFFIYYLLKESYECDCDCETLCDLLKLTY